MGFNGIGGYLNSPGMIPWEVILLYFVAASIFVVVYGRSHGAVSKFKTVDYVYIGIGAAFTVVWEFFVGPLLNKFVPASLGAYIGFGFFGRILILFIVAGLVRKVGVGVMSMAIFNLLSDIFKYGFAGEPMYTIYETLTYGLFVDIIIALMNGRIFGIGSVKEGSSKLIVPSTYKALIPAFTGALIGFLWAIPDNVLYAGFFNPFLYGGIVNWQSISFNFVAALPGDIAFGVIAAFIARRVSAVLGQ